MSEDSREKEKAMPLEGINLVVIREGVSLSCMFCERVLLRIPAGSIAVLKNLLVDLQCISHACKTIREWDHTTTNVDKTSYIPIDEGE